MNEIGRVLRVAVMAIAFAVAFVAVAVFKAGAAGTAALARRLRRQAPGGEIIEGEWRRDDGGPSGEERERGP